MHSEACCDDFERFRGDREYGWSIHHEGDDRGWVMPVAVEEGPTWPWEVSAWAQIHYCPFCGEKL